MSPVRTEVEGIPGVEMIRPDVNGDRRDLFLEIFIAPDVAHGFAALTEPHLVYWVTHYLDNTDEHSVASDDPTLSVLWKVRDPILSSRAGSAPPLDWDRVAAALA